MGLLLIVLTTFFIGRIVEAKGYSSFQWRVRHVSACFFVYTLVAMISISITNDISIAFNSGILGMIGIIVYRYQHVKYLEPASK